MAWAVGRYRLTARAHMAPAPGASIMVLEAAAEVQWDGKPGPHMHPVDAPAIANVKRVMDEGGWPAAAIGELECTGTRLSAAHLPPRR